MPVASLSMFDRVFLGMDEDGHRVEVELVYRNILIGGEPGGGKSVALNNVVAHAALSPDCRLWLFDGKQVELGLWADVAEVFVGNDIGECLDTLRGAAGADGRPLRVAASAAAPQDRPGGPGGRHRRGGRRGGLLLGHHRPQGRTRRSSPGCCGTSSPGAGRPG